jgi:hypothetical protein
MGSMGHVKPNDIHSSVVHFFQHFWIAGGGADGADYFGFTHENLRKVD